MSIKITGLNDIYTFKIGKIKIDDNRIRKKEEEREQHISEYFEIDFYTIE
jgi:hypothetical protein